MAQRSFIVGIAGGSASGKTTMALALQEAFNQKRPPCPTTIFHTDHYFTRDKSIGPTFISPSTGVERFNCNHPDAVNTQRLMSDLQASVVGTDAPAVVIVEGLMVLHELRTRALLDLRLFIELDADERALRRMLRDMKRQQGSGEAESIATYYRESARIGHAAYVEPSRVHADFILRGDADLTRTVPMIGAVIESGIAELTRTNSPSGTPCLPLGDKDRE